MSRYHGGKQRLGPAIASQIIKLMTESGLKNYCEPFIGMAGVMNPVIQRTMNDPDHGKYSGGDINDNVISMWNSICNKTIKSLPRSCSPERYAKLRSRRGRNIHRSHTQKKSAKRSREILKDKAIKGFLGHACSFGGVYMKGFMGSYIKKNDSRLIKKISNSRSKKGSRRVKTIHLDISKQARKVEEIGKHLCDANVKLTSGSYEQFSNLSNHVIYCDPPYDEYNEYYDADRNRINFDTKKFWKWAEKMSKNNVVVVSGYSAPENWDTYWSAITRSGQMGANRQRREKLFIYSDIL